MFHKLRSLFRVYKHNFATTAELGIVSGKSQTETKLSKLHHWSIYGPMISCPPPDKFLGLAQVNHDSVSSYI